MKDSSLNEKKDVACKKIAVIGGDLRQLEAAKAFAAKGYACYVYGLDVVGESHDFQGVVKAETLAEAVLSAMLILLPLPYSHDGVTINAPLSTVKIRITSLFLLLSNRQKLAAGMVGASLPEGFEAFDYASSETFAIRNARATVEGALAIAIREMPTTLSGASAAVVGYGRIGKMLAETLKALGARVTVVARKAQDRAWAWAQGLHAIPYPELPDEAERFDILFNTVPSTVIERDTLARLKKEALILELASLPGGVELGAAKELGVQVIRAPGLPGKYAPRTAGNIIADCVADAFGL